MPTEISHTDRVCLFIRNAIFLLGALLGLAVLVRFIFIRSWNYDEISHVHMAWLLTVGEVPYRDFAINHFPFFWVPVSALLRILPHTPGGLTEMRGVAVVLNAVFAGSLGAIILSDLPVRQRIWAAACFGVAVFNPMSIHFLIEIRPDALANALLFATLAWLKIRKPEKPAAFFAAGLCIGAAVLINTKYIAFPFILACVALAMHLRRFREIRMYALMLVLGFCAAVACGYCTMRLLGIDIEQAWRIVVTYNAAAEKTRTFGYGLALAVAGQPWLLGFVLAGITGYGVFLIRNHRRPDLFTVAIFVFLIVNLITCTRPWKQYSASWFLLAAYFPAKWAAGVAEGLRPPAQIAAALGILVAMLAGLAGMPIVDPSGAGEIRAEQDRLMDWTNRNVPPDGYVSAGFPMHPLFRRDSFFKVVMDMTGNGGDGFELLMPSLTTGSYSEHFQQSGYEKELALRPPAMIVLRSLYTDAQLRALDNWLAHEGIQYQSEVIPDTHIAVLVRGNIHDAK